MTILVDIKSHTAISSDGETINLPGHWDISPAPPPADDSNRIAWRVMVAPNGASYGLILRLGMPFHHIPECITLVEIHEKKHLLF